MKSELNTIVVPAKPEKYNKIFLGKNCWYGVKIAKWRKIDYLAIYQTAPISKITDYVKVSGIEEWELDSNKSRLNFCKNSRTSFTINFDKNNDPILRRSRYTSIEKLLKAQNLKDLFD